VSVAAADNAITGDTAASRPVGDAPSPTRRAAEPHAWVVAPRGDLDLASCDQLAARLDEVIDAGAVILVLDLGEVDFVDSSGIREIVRAARRLDDNGGRLLVENASGATQRILEVTGILEQLRVRAAGDPRSS
jgi:anti-anti-sigma factor